MDARHDQKEMNQAINKFQQQLEKQEEKDFKDLAALLSHLPKPAQLARVRSLHVCGLGYGGWFSPGTGRRSGLYVTLSELCLYRHAQDHRLLTRDILTQ